MTEPSGGWLGLGDRLGNDPFLAFVVAAIAALTLIIVLSIIWLTGRALWEVRVSRLRDRFWLELGQRLASVVGEPAAEAAWLEAARAYRRDVLQHCLNEYLIRTAGEYKEGLARLYRALGLLDIDLIELRSWRWSVRMRALRRLAAVVTSEHRAVIARLASEGGEVRLLVAQIIGRIGNADDVLPLLATWSLTSRLSEYPLHVMLDALQPDALRVLLAHWDELTSAKIQRILLDAAARTVPGACHEILPRAALHASLEVRIAAAHACGAMSSPQTFALLGTLSQDAAWEVRAQAVKALASHPSNAAVEILADALTDKNFWVRQNAAASLGRQGHNGVVRLRRIIADASDRYARDAAEHVLTDLGLIEQAAAT